MSLRTLFAAPAGPNGVSEGLYWPIFLAVCAWLLLRWANPASDLILLSSLTITWTALVSPFVQDYDYLVLILPLLLVVVRISVERPSRRPWLLASLALGAWVFGSIDQWFHTWLERGVVWTTLSRWFGEDWVAAAWEHSKRRLPLCCDAGTAWVDSGVAVLAAQAHGASGVNDGRSGESSDKGAQRGQPQPPFLVNS